MTAILDYAQVLESIEADGRAIAGTPASWDVSSLIMDVQARGLRVEAEMERRSGGAGPTDAGMLWIEGYPVTAPTGNATAAASPYLLKAEDDGYGIYRDDVRVASARAEQRPRFYDLKTADGISYEKIALLHLDSLASTVVQTCAYWGNADQCTFCGIGLSLESGRTIVKKTPEMLAEVAIAARDLDGAVDATLTTGSSRGVDRGARYVGRCGQAVKEASGLPVEVQFEPPLDLDVINEVGDMGIDSVGIHVETFDPQVLARVAPAKAASGIESYFAAWERAVKVFGEGQVSTYVILGMGEDPEVTIAGARRAIDIGVYPFVVSLKPVAGSLMEDWPSPSREYVEPIYRRIQAYMTLRGMNAGTAKAGCARCQACSGLKSLEPLAPRTVPLQIGPRPSS
ncbi:MAG: MSMEG_0568 family radical SAM protein [Actinobacteria bacterium]|nr:MSMEG_0568 family radical SAM protein [Actinomycetota bacterium]